MEKSNIPDLVFERIRRTHAKRLYSREEPFPIVPRLMPTLYDGNGEWVTARNLFIEANDTVPGSIKLKIRSDAL